MRSETVFARLGEEIERLGPVPFDRFMEICLYDPDGGYFATGELRSDRTGDFLTSPEVSPVFGDLIARFVSAEHDRIGDPFDLVEVGGGSGSLLRPLIDGLGFTPTSIAAVERSTAARASISERVPEAQLADDVQIERGVVVANEVLDNIPAAVAVRRGDGWFEAGVSVAGEELVHVELPVRPEVAVWADRHAGAVPEGGRVEVQIAAGEWVERICAGLVSGAVLLIDYGDAADGLASRRAEGTVRTYRGHHLGPDPLLAAGATDITMDVAFDAIAAAAQRGGATTAVMRQDDFLIGLGAREVIDDLRSQELEAARDGRSAERLVLKSRVTGVETLLHPRGLGDFRVLIARTEA